MHVSFRASDVRAGGVRIGGLRALRPVLALSVALALSACTVTANPFSPEELAAIAATASDVAVDQEPLTGPVTLYEAMARALKYNVDHRVEMMNVALGRANARVARADLLPDLVAKAGIYDRNNSPASFSFSGTNLAVSDVASTGQDPGSISADLTLSYHVLDFGLSFIRAKQAADRTLIAQERRRRVVNRIVADVRTAYWRAVSAERLLGGFDALEGRVERALANTRRLYRARATSPVAALTFERELVEIKTRIARLQRELRTARLQLASLMNLQPGTPFTLAVPPRRLVDLDVDVTRDELFDLALTQRPELREVGYQKRINTREKRAAVLALLPSITGYAGLNADTNDLLVNPNWVSVGARVGFDVMNLFRYPARRRNLEAKEELLDAQAKATAMAIMLQVEVARTRFRFNRQHAAAAGEFNNVQRKLLQQIAAQARAGVASEQTLVREKMNALVAEAQYDVAYAELQNSFANLFAAVGEAPHEHTITTDMSVAELAAMLRDTWRARGDGHG